MLSFIYRVALVACCLALLGAPALGGHKFSERHRDHLSRHEKLARSQEKPAIEERQSDFRFLNNNTQPYQVTSLPDVPFDVGELYSGNIPIDTANASRALFFVFEPTIGDPVDEVTIWLNGGPGCSSLEGFFQEVGRFTWRPGTFQPVVNDYSWVNLTNMLWVEQPVGTGFATGDVTATSEEEIAQDFIMFFRNFQDTFGIKNFKIFVTGESYAGRYVPYISAAMLDQNDTTYYNLSGALVYDPVIGDFTYTQEEVTAVPYALANNAVLNLNASFVDQLQSLHQSCGYADLIDTYLTFPPPGNQPPYFFNFTSDANCDVFDMINNAALHTNPCFDIYEINQACPLLWDVLSFPTELVQTPDGANTYFNRSDVKAAMHAPMDVDWAECATSPVFVGDGGPEDEDDVSADPIQKVLPQVIEETNRVLVGNGDYDMIIITNGTLLAIQNMTWGGLLGFQEAPSTPIEISLPDLEYESTFDMNNLGGYDDPQGLMGIQHYERGLMWVESYQTGHMQPQFQPRLAYRHLQWVLGRIDVI